MKSDYSIAKASKEECAPILYRHHYISVLGLSRGFKSGHNFGLFYGGQRISEDVVFGAELVGVCIFTGFPVPELAVGLFGLDRNDQEGLFELSRLCIDPAHQQSEHNLASWFVSRSIRALRKITQVRAILSYADSDYHSGIVYAASNFEYYGLTAEKCDHWGAGGKHQRGKLEDGGKWVKRSRKHRFLRVFDTRLAPKWEKQKWTNNDNGIPENDIRGRRKDHSVAIGCRGSGESDPNARMDGKKVGPRSDCACSG